MFPTTFIKTEYQNFKEASSGKLTWLHDENIYKRKKEKHYFI